MFTFKLQSVLNHRKRQEEEKQRELAVVNQEIQSIHGALDALVAGRDENALRFTEVALTTRDVRPLKLYEDFLEGRDIDIDLKRKELEEAMKRLRAKQEELQEYLKRRKVLEVYRDRLQENYANEERRRERVFLDETATNMWFREAR